MNSEFFSLLSVWIRFSRREWLAVARLMGVVALMGLMSGCVVAARSRPVAVVKVPPPPAVVVAEPPRVVEKVVVVREAPPPPRREIVVERDRPSAAHVWIAGHWRYDGRVYVWMPGHWERPPRAHVAWVEPRWERHDGGYIYVGGVWR